MPNMSTEKVKMTEQNPNVRNKNYGEVALGYTAEEAREEAQRCLNCKNKPCMQGCPVNVDIPEFIAHIADGSYDRAYETITRTNTLPSVCGRVCPQEAQCEKYCVRGIKGESVAIGRLERFCGDHHLKNSESSENCKNFTENTENNVNLNNIKVAVIGSGPAGLTCAGDLAKMGYSVDVFEALHAAGGVLVYGIPEFRLPKTIVRKEIENIKNLGVQIHTNMVIGKILSADDLFEQGYKAIFIGSGAGLPSFLGIDGENSNGVFSANEYLTRVNLMNAYDKNYDTPIKKSKKVAVIGGGNVAMDSARCALRLGAESVYIVYRRGEDEMPARVEEIHHAKEEGVIFKLLTNPLKINADGNGNAVSLDCEQMELGTPDASGRRRPVAIPNSTFTIEADTVIIAIGTNPNPIIKDTTPGLATDKRGCLITSDGVTTMREGIFAGGDAVTGAATVILAMGAGKEAAKKIHEYIRCVLKQ